MRKFFIGSFEVLITVLVVLMCIGVVISALVTMTSRGGFLAGLGILLAGGFYVILTAGMMYIVPWHSRKYQTYGRSHRADVQPQVMSRPVRRV